MNGRMPHSIRHPRFGQDGFNMAEVLVTLLILSIGLLGLASLQMVGLQNNHSAYQRSQATVLSYQIVDAIRANRQVATDSGAYDWEFGFPGPANQDTTARRDLDQWVTNLDEILPEGRGAIKVESNGQVTVQVRWLDERRAADVESQRVTFVYRSEI